jgi:hypothetical protein
VALVRLAIMLTYRRRINYDCEEQLIGVSITPFGQPQTFRKRCRGEQERDEVGPTSAMLAPGVSAVKPMRTAMRLPTQRRSR